MWRQACSVHGAAARLFGKGALDVLDLPPQHEGLQDLMQPVDHHHPLLVRQPLLRPRTACCNTPLLEARASRAVYAEGGQPCHVTGFCGIPSICSATWLGLCAERVGWEGLGGVRAFPTPSQGCAPRWRLTAPSVHCAERARGDLRRDGGAAPRRRRTALWRRSRRPGSHRTSRGRCSCRRTPGLAPARPRLSAGHRC